MTSGPSVGMLLDLLVTGLLAATIVYAVILNRKLAALRQGREELRALINDFTTASENAQAGMAEMRHASETTGRTLKDMVDEAQALREDLSFLIERGGVVADHMEQNVRANRTVRTASAERFRDGGPARHTGPSQRADEGDDAMNKLRRILEATR